MQRLSLLIALCLTFSLSAKDKKEEGKGPDFSKVINGLSYRSVGPALTSGRVVDIAIHPDNAAIYYVASAAGGVWKTVNNGVSFEPLFDGEGSYSIGCITIDPNNPNVIWVGSGENNNQRSVAYGDGLYKSENGGASWKNVGLKNSEHIGMIKVDPRNSQRVLVAAYGPLWSEGGERGIYETLDGGVTWDKILDVSEHTGFNEIHFDRSNPDVIYATAHQRRRHVYTYISGGPESAIYKSINGGKDWNKINKGLPAVDLGRIGLALSYHDDQLIYAIVESKKGGLYMSTNGGASWAKQSGKKTSGNYYQEIFCDPHTIGKLYVMDSYAAQSIDHGKSWESYGGSNKHVDDHVIWIDPRNEDHHIVGCDGGLYETYDGGALWSFKANLPVTQFYKVAVDNDTPYYNIYGGTQDNFSLGGPSQTNNLAGILNADWFITKGGDGFESQVDPQDPNIVYAQSQYGWLARFNKATGEKVNIRPKESKDEKAYRWNWDAPLIISPHNSSRLYFAANVLFKSDDRGDSWQTISPDLTAQIDRNKIPVMGKQWSMDAVAKNKSTSIYGNIVALTESPLQEGLIYVGTDDGLIQVTEDGGKTWKKYNKFPGVPADTYVNFLYASKHYAHVVYAVFNNHKNGDFKPYVCQSEDGGKTWNAIQSDLPERGSVYCIAEDHKNAALLFVGTEFGVHTSINGGRNWLALTNGLPTVAVRDIAIQERENDLVLATFGRGFYVMDDYTPLRLLAESILEKDAHIFPIETTKVYVQANPLGKKGKGFQGDALYAAENAPIGAVFSIYIKDKIKTLKDVRKEKEKEGNVDYPTAAELVAEDNEAKPYLLIEIKNAEGKVIRRMKEKSFSGMKRVVWNYRHANADPVKLNQDDFKSGGRLAIPGQYSVSVIAVKDGVPSTLIENKAFSIEPMYERYSTEEYAAMSKFHDEVEDVERVLWGLNEQINDQDEKLDYLIAAVKMVPEMDIKVLPEIQVMKKQLVDINISVNGNTSLSKREFETKTTIATRIGMISWGFWLNYQVPTKSHFNDLTIVKEEMTVVIDRLKLTQATIERFEDQLNNMGAPYTPGRTLEFKN
jgi:photosystem II stability/assembly factor-like uncharacterized protein